MFSSQFRSLMNLRSASADIRRPRLRFAPRLVPLEVRALLSTITVTDDADSGAGSLRAAIAEAGTGDTIKFAHSAYGTIKLSSGPLVVATGVDIDGPGPNHVTVSGNDASTVFDVEAGVTATISGLTITKGSFATAYTLGAGGIDNDGNLTVSDCVVTGNAIAPGSDAFGAGGIVNSQTGTLTVTDSTISGNTSPYGGGIDSYATLTVTDSTISGNSATFGGGINSLGTLTATGSTISGNSASGGGGGISTYRANATLTGCTVSGNSAGQGGGINTYNANLNLVRSSVSGNSGDGIDIGGGSAPTIATLTITNSSIVGNTNDQDTPSYDGIAVGGGIVSNSADVTVTGSLVANNTVEGSLAVGGAIAMETFFTKDAANVLTVTDSTFEGNQAIGAGPAGNSMGGAIHTDPYASVTVSNSSFLNNTASASYAAQGGAMDLGTLVQGTITGTLFSGNKAVGTGDGGGSAQGGAISAENEGFPPGSPLNISGSTLVGNEAIGGSGSTTAYGGAAEGARSGTPATPST